MSESRSCEHGLVYGCAACAAEKKALIRSDVTRLRELARDGARANHVQAAVISAIAGDDGHVFVVNDLDDYGFSACPHPNCVLVRVGAPAPRCEVCFGDLPENRCEKPAGHLDVHLVATGFVWRTMESAHEQQAPTVQSEAATAREVDSRSRVSGADALRSEAGVVTLEAAPAVLPQLRWNRDADGQWFVMLSTEAGLMADGRTPNEALHAFGSVLEAAFSDECEECRGKPTPQERIEQLGAQRSDLLAQLRTLRDEMGQRCRETYPQSVGGQHVGPRLYQHPTTHRFATQEIEPLLAKVDTLLSGSTETPRRTIESYDT